VIAVDTSVVVAAFASWHEANSAAAAVLARGPLAPVHVLVETYSVLTRLPPPHRAPANIITDFLARHFRRAPLTLPPQAWPELLQRASEAGITGGAIYDALVGATAGHAGATLLTRDRRATAVYNKLGISYELIA